MYDLVQITLYTFIYLSHFLVLLTFLYCMVFTESNLKVTSYFKNVKVGSKKLTCNCNKLLLPLSNL